MRLWTSEEIIRELRIRRYGHRVGLYEICRAIGVKHREHIQALLFGRTTEIKPERRALYSSYLNAPFEPPQIQELSRDRLWELLIERVMLSTRPEYKEMTAGARRVPARTKKILSTAILPLPPDQVFWVRIPLAKRKLYRRNRVKLRIYAREYGRRRRAANRVKLNIYWRDYQRRRRAEKRNARDRADVGVPQPAVQNPI